MKPFKLILLLSLLVNFSCQDKDPSTPPIPETTVSEGTPTTPSDTETQDPLKFVQLKTPAGEIIHTSIAYTSKDQTQGLQGVKEDEFKDDEGKLFFYLTTKARTFWMPNTYFNLDIFYLDENLKIIDVVWNLEHYTGDQDSEIPRAPTITSRHVLEMKNGSAISASLKVGDQLLWNSPLTLRQTESKIRQQL